MGRARGIAKMNHGPFAVDGRVPSGTLVELAGLGTGRHASPPRARTTPHGFSRRFALNSRRDQRRKIVDDEISSAFGLEAITVTPYAEICYQIHPEWHATC